MNRHFHQRPTKADIEFADHLDDEYVWLNQNYPEDHPPQPYPTPLGNWLLLHAVWLWETVKYWRCRKGHKYGPWQALHNDPEQVDGFVITGRMTGRVRNCVRCGYQHGQGEY